MPNWCSNGVVIYGDEKKMDELNKALTRPYKIKYNNKWDEWEKIESDDGEEVQDYGEFFNRLRHALPKEYTPGYKNNIDYLGTKWGVSELTHAEYSPTHQLTLGFETAWSPALVGMLQVCRHYGLSMDYEYSEPGCDFGGKARYEDGVFKLADNLDYTLYEILERGEGTCPRQEVYDDICDRYEITEAEQDINSVDWDHIEGCSNLEDYLEKCGEVFSGDEVSEWIESHIGSVDRLEKRIEEATNKLFEIRVEESETSNEGEVDVCPN